MKVYLDHSATTPLDERVLQKMIPFMTETFGNTSSLHFFGREALSAVDAAREKIARVLHCQAKEIYFTSGGTESDNWALCGIVSAHKNKGKHIVTTKIEHPAILSTCKKLEREGYEITYVEVGEDGIVRIEDVVSAIRVDTVLVSVMYANNEIGSIQPISEIGRFCREKGIIFHTDAVQAIGSVDIDVDRDNIDLLSFSSHKFYGPKGIGALYVRSGIKIDGFMLGGEQERKKRAGTLNTPGVIGTAEALRLCAEEREIINEKISFLRDHFVNRVEKEIPFCLLNGSRNNRLAGNANFSFDYVDADALLLTLDRKGIAASSGSACSSGSIEPSHVLLAIGKREKDARNAIRFSIGKENTLEEMDYVVDALKESIEALRSYSDLFKKEKGKIYSV